MPRSTKRMLAALAAAAALTIPLAACSSETDTGGAPAGGAIDTSTASGEVNYWLWDANQMPAYQACAAKFQEANPNVTVKITQYGWGDYWTKITNGFVAGTAPDVFTNHLAKYPEFVSQGQLLALDETLAKDGVNLDQYQPGLANLWVGQDGKRYGLPKDFDTVALFYNKKLIADAGVSEEELKNLAWNPTDGGTYEKVIAHLTVDANGKRGDEPGFDKTKVKVYGLGLDGGRRRRQRPDPVEHVHRHHRLDPYRQEPVGHQVQLRRRAVPEHHRLVAQPDRQGLHALPRRCHRTELR